MAEQNEGDVDPESSGREAPAGRKLRSPAPPVIAVRMETLLVYRRDKQAELAAASRALVRARVLVRLARSLRCMSRGAAPPLREGERRGRSHARGLGTEHRVAVGSWSRCSFGPVASRGTRPTGLSAAGASTMMRRTCARPTATTTPRRIATTISGFAARRLRAFLSPRTSRAAVIMVAAGVMIHSPPSRRRASVV